MTAIDPHLQLDDGVDGGAQLEQILPAPAPSSPRWGPAGLRLSTPCDGWSTRDLLDHVIGGAGMFADAFAGAPLRALEQLDSSSGRIP